MRGAKWCLRTDGFDDECFWGKKMLNIDKPERGIVIDQFKARLQYEDIQPAESGGFGLLCAVIKIPKQ